MIFWQEIITLTCPIHRRYEIFHTNFTPTKLLSFITLNVQSTTPSLTLQNFAFSTKTFPIQNTCLVFCCCFFCHIFDSWTGYAPWVRWGSAQPKSRITLHVKQAMKSCQKTKFINPLDKKNILGLICQTGRFKIRQCIKICLIIVNRFL